MGPRWVTIRVPTHARHTPEVTLLSEATACAPSVVADTIMRTIELGVTITDAAVDEKVTTIFCAPVARDPEVPGLRQGRSVPRYRDAAADGSSGGRLSAGAASRS